MKNAQIRVSLVGVTGYTGQVFYALAQNHPNLIVDIVKAKSVAEWKLCPSYERCELLVLATPGEVSKAWVEALWEHPSLRILDLSDAYRRDPRFFYAIPELFGPAPKSQRYVANPGCYPTTALLALYPLLQAQAIEASSICVLGTSGASGAGKSPNDVLHFCHLAENTFPYKVGHHRHIPEIEHHLGAPISFVTQILAAQRGMLSTCFVKARCSPAKLHEHLVEYYRDYPYVTILEQPDRALGIRQAVGSHQAFLAVGPSEGSGMVPVFCSIDNLMRGASSQAMHSLNLWWNFVSDAGLPPPRETAPAAPLCFGATIMPALHAKPSP